MKIKDYTKRQRFLIDNYLDLLGEMKPKDRKIVFRHMMVEFCLDCGKNILRRECDCECTIRIVKDDEIEIT